MKKLLFILAISLAFFVTSNAQSVGPRFDSTGTSGDNTGRVLNYRFVTLNGIVGTDTVGLHPRGWENIYRIVLPGATSIMALNFITIGDSYAGDKIDLMVTGPTGAQLKFIDSNFITAGTDTLSTNGSAVIHFVFNGSKWAEVSRTNL